MGIVEAGVSRDRWSEFHMLRWLTNQVSVCKHGVFEKKETSVLETVRFYLHFVVSFCWI